MGRVLLISGNTTLQPYPVFPLGLAMVADALRRAGHEVSLWDALARDAQGRSLVEAVKAARPDVVGFSLRNVDDFNFDRQDFYIQAYADLVKTVREATAAPIVLGGAGFSLFPEAILEASGADYGIQGEGERAFPMLVETLIKGDKPVDRILLQGPVLLAEEIRSPMRDPYLVSYYSSRGGLLNVQTKRGCPHLCAYCSYPKVEGSQYRFRPAREVASEFLELRQKYGAPYIAITDSVFNDTQDHWRSVAEALARQGGDIPWMAYFRPQSFTPQDALLLKAAGLKAVEWGSDAATDTTLAGLGKGFRFTDVEAANNLFALQGIHCAHFVIFGGPDETMETSRQGLENLKRLEHCVVFACLGVRIMPHTAIHRRALAEGLVDVKDPLLKPIYYFSPRVNAQELGALVQEAFQERTDRIYPPDKGIERAAALHKMGFHGPAWDQLLQGRRRQVRP